MVELKSNSANYSFLLGKCQFSSELTCLGDQLVKILMCIKEELRDHCWYVFDVFGSSHHPTISLFPQDQEGVSFFIKTEDLMDKAQQMIQFERGVFIAFPRNNNVTWNPEFLPETEAPNGLQHPEAKIEIRAFDYSYFEVYTPSTILSEVLKCFNYHE